jgi:hypothetical protein
VHYRLQFLLLVELIVFKIVTVSVCGLLSIECQKFFPLEVKIADICLYQMLNWRMYRMVHPHPIFILFYSMCNNN